MKNANGILKRLKQFSERYSILFILIFAFTLRARGIDFGLPYIYTDEHDFINPSIGMLVSGNLHPAESITPELAPPGSFFGFGNPGSFLMYVLLIIFSIYFIFGYFLGHIHSLGEFQQLFISNPTLFYLSGRLLMVFFGVTTVYLTYLIARNLFNKPVGLLASFCLAIAPLHITYSRLIRTDVVATMLIMFSIYFLLKYFESNKNIKLLISSSLFAGFSIAAKYTSGIIIIPILIYCLINDSKQKKILTVKYIINSLKIKTNLSRAISFIFIGFFIFAPFVILDFHHSIEDIIKINSIKRPGHGSLPGIQNHVWYLTDALQEGTGGLFFEMFAGLGLLLLIRKKSQKKYLFLIFPISYFLIIGSYIIRWDRYIIPILPFVAILFGVGYYYSYKYLVKIRSSNNLRPEIFSLFAVMIIFASIPTIIIDIDQGTKLTRTDTRTLAKEWIENNIPDGSKIAYQPFYATPPLHINPGGNFTLMKIKIVSQPLSFYKNESVDYIIVSDYLKNRYYSEPNEYPIEIARYQELKNNAELIKTFENKENPGPVIEIYRLN